MRRLRSYVHIGGAVYGPGDEVPAAVAERIGEHAWEDSGGEVRGEDGPETVGFTDPGAAGSSTPTGAGEAPPRSGRGSGVEAWRAYAEQNDLDVSADAGREDIIAAAETAGLIEREE